MSKDLAVIDLNATNYFVGYNFNKILHNIIKEQIEGGVTAAINDFVKEITTKDSNGDYSRFTTKIDNAFKEAIKNSSFEITDKMATNDLKRLVKLEDIVKETREKAKYATKLLGEISMSGNPKIITVVMEFLENLKKLGEDGNE